MAWNHPSIRILLSVHVRVHCKYVLPYILVYLIIMFSVHDFIFQALERAFFLHEKGQGEEAKLQYLQLAQAFEEFIGKRFNDWVVNVDKELGKYLNQPLICRYSIQHVQCTYTCTYSTCTVQWKVWRNAGNIIILTVHVQ